MRSVRSELRKGALVEKASVIIAKLSPTRAEKNCLELSLGAMQFPLRKKAKGKTRLLFQPEY